MNIFRDITIGNTIPRVSSRDYPSRELGFQEFLAHRAIINVVLPLLSTSDSLSLYQAFYVYALKHTVPVDFAAAILSHMSYVLSHPKCGLPYGHIITHLLRHLPISFSKVSLPGNCGITHSTLGHMKMSFNSRFACWTWHNRQVTNLTNPIREVPVTPPPPTDIPESSSSSSHNTCAPLLKKLLSCIKDGRKQARKEYERTKIR